MDNNKEIDLILAVSCSIAEEGQSLTLRELADLCEIPVSTMRTIEMGARRKFKAAFERSFSAGF